MLLRTLALKIYACCGTYATGPGVPTSRSPRTSGMAPRMAESNEDLPEPVFPTTARIEPAATRMLTSRSSKASLAELQRNVQSRSSSAPGSCAARSLMLPCSSSAANSSPMRPVATLACVSWLMMFGRFMSGCWRTPSRAKVVKATDGVSSVLYTMAQVMKVTMDTTMGIAFIRKFETARRFAKDRIRWSSSCREALVERSKEGSHA
mmetsp:Transcript_4898/g.14450  ORF Transcript_4898/g.14450 Transcript_4898/m.14450 type:complete len:207 (+) Transcript_4898:2487-3107(+)